MFLSIKTRKKSRTKLAVESLGCRIVPAVLLSKIDLDGDAQTDDVRIIGDGQHTKIAIADDGVSQIHMQIDANGDGDYADAARGDLDTFFNYSGKSFVVDAQLRGGNDSFVYVSTGAMSGSARNISVDLGAGYDTFNWTQNNSVTANSRIALDVTGGGGNDTISITHNEVRNSQMSVKVDAGLGNDTYNLAFDRIDDSASVDVHTELGAGLNIHNADIHEVGFGNKATFDMTVIGGNQKDTIELRMHDDIGDGTIASRFSAVVDLLGGHDSFKALYDVGGNVFRVDDHSQASLVVRGGFGNDSISAGQNGAIGTIRLDPDALLSIDLDGGAGNDTVVVDFGSANAFENVGTIFVRMDGGYGNDVLSCLLANEVDTTGSYDVTVRGSAGNDTITFNLINSGGTPTYGPAGGVILDGGTGIDSVINSNPAVTKGVGIETVI